jgi:hypothetical protein
MNLRVWLGIGAAVVAGIVAHFFTVSGESVVEWNDKAVALHRRCEQAWKRFRPELNLYLRGKGHSIGEETLDTACLEYQSEVHLASRELGYLTPPDHDLCRAFQDELNRFVEFQKGASEEVGQLVEYMKTNNPPEEEDIEEARAILEDLERRGQEILERLAARQRSVADKFKLTLR